MAVAIFEGGTIYGVTTSVAKIVTIVITGMSGTPADTTYTITVTNEADGTYTVSVAGVTSVNATATALAAAWNAATTAFCTGITASVAAATVTLTADTAGVPFYVASSVTGGTGTIGAATTTTVNAGPKDYNSAENWSTSAVPTTSESVVIPAGSGAILYGLDQSAISINGFRVENGYDKDQRIGGTDGGYLKITLDTSSEFYFTGQARAWINIGASDVDPVIVGTYVPSTGQYGLRLKGSAVSDLYHNGGNVGFGVDADDTTSECDVFHVSNVSGTSVLTIGKNVTDTAGTAHPDVIQDGGIVVAHCEIDNLTRYAGSYTQADSAAATVWAAVTIYGNDPVYANAAGTYATTTLAGNSDGIGGNLTTQTVVAKTFTDVTVKSARYIIDTRNGSAAYTNAIDFDQVNPASGTFNIGSNKKLTVTNS